MINPSIESSDFLFWHQKKKLFFDKKLLVVFRQLYFQYHAFQHHHTYLFRLVFLHFTKNSCRFLTPKVKSDTDMINPSIESSDFLFWHEKIWDRIFENFVETDKVHFTSSNLVCACVFTHTLNFKIRNLLCLFSTKFSKFPTQNFFNVKIENRSF